MTIKDAQIGAFHLNDFDFLVIPDKQFLSFPEQQIDGLIGGSVLSVFAMLVDFPHRSLTS